MNELKVLHISVCFFFLSSCKPFCSCTQILSSQGHCTSSKGLNIINLHAIYDQVTGPEQPIYVFQCVEYESKKGGKDQE